MSGSRRITVGAITQGKLRGKAMADALAAGLTSEQDAGANSKKK